MNLDPTKELPDCTEGPEAFRRFDEGITQLLSVSHDTLVRRERAYKKRAARNPHKRGPKPKLKTSV
jgi:hypothetical protein